MKNKLFFFVFKKKSPKRHNEPYGSFFVAIWQKFVDKNHEICRHFFLTVYFFLFDKNLKICRKNLYFCRQKSKKSSTEICRQKFLSKLFFVDKVEKPMILSTKVARLFFGGMKDMFFGSIFHKGVKFFGGNFYSLVSV